MSRTQKTYKHFTFRSKKTWQQTTLKLCTMCGTRCCGDPITIDGTKAKSKSKGTHKEKKRYVAENVVEDFSEDSEDDFIEEIVEDILEHLMKNIVDS